MGTRQVFTLAPISPWATDPFNDAIKEISAATGLLQSTIAANAALIYWTDPCMSLGHGTGRWEWAVRYNFESESSVERDIYVIGSRGNSSLSVGGPIAAIAPNFAVNPFVAANVFQKSSPLSAGGGGEAGQSSAGVGGTSILKHALLPTNPGSLPADIAQISGLAAATAIAYKYWYDPQTGAGAALPGGGFQSLGTGLWMMRTYAWSGNYVAFDIAQSSGCALSSSGGSPATPPPSFAGWTQVHSVWQMR
jgi:hypothetical protein